MKKSSGVSGNPAKAAEQRAARSERATSKVSGETPVTEKPRGYARRVGSWVIDWLPFWVIGLLTTAGMWVTSYRTDGHVGSVLSAFLAPLAVMFFTMPFEAFIHRVWRWLVVFALVTFSVGEPSFYVSTFGVAWLMHQTYRVEFPNTSKVHRLVESVRERRRARRAGRVAASA